MISIGVVSDSHKNFKNLQKAVDFLVADRKINMLFHLGDFYEDLDNIENMNADLKIFKVPGTQNYRYNDQATVKRIKMRIGKIEFMLAHVPRKHQADLPDDYEIENSIVTGNIQALLYGHTHQYDIFYNNITNILYINPGHLKDNDEQGTPPTFAHITVSENRITIRIYNLINEIMSEKRYII